MALFTADEMGEIAKASVADRDTHLIEEMEKIELVVKDHTSYVSSPDAIRNVALQIMICKRLDWLRAR